MTEIEVTQERWPGYDEQSWQERFAELDRRHKALSDHAIENVMRQAALASRPVSDKEVRELVRVHAAAIVRAFRALKIPREYPDEVYDEFESLTLTPMIEAFAATTLEHQSATIAGLQSGLEAAARAVQHNHEQYEYQSALLAEAREIMARWVEAWDSIDEPFAPKVPRIATSARLWLSKVGGR